MNAKLSIKLCQPVIGLKFIVSEAILIACMHTYSVTEVTD